MIHEKNHDRLTSQPFPFSITRPDIEYSTIKMQFLLWTVAVPLLVVPLSISYFLQQDILTGFLFLSFYFAGLIPFFIPFLAFHHFRKQAKEIYDKKLYRKGKVVSFLPDKKRYQALLDDGTTQLMALDYEMPDPKRPTDRFFGDMYDIYAYLSTKKIREKEEGSKRIIENTIGWDVYYYRNKRGKFILLVALPAPKEE